MLAIAVAVYSLAMVAANLSVATFGPWISPLNSFLFIGLDLTMRDWLHVRLRPHQLGILIVATGLLTYVLAPSASIVAIASASAFLLAAVVDWSVFSVVRGSWLRRANASNVAGAAVDSLVFPTIAFGAFLWHIVALQFAAKVAGGFLWALLLRMVSK